MSGILSATFFPEEEAAQRSKLLVTLLCVNVAAITVSMLAITISDPARLHKSILTMAMIAATCAVCLVLNRRGWTRLAGMLFITFMISLISVRAYSLGGIRAPSVASFYVYVLTAGLLLGDRAGLIVGALCGLIELGLVGAEHLHLIANTVLTYTPMQYWWLNFFYLVPMVVLMLVASRTVGKAFGRVTEELLERRKTEQSLQMALEAGNIGVWQWTPDTGALSWDERMYEMYGVPAGTPMNCQSWSTLIEPEERQDQEDMLASAQGHRKSQREFRITTPHGIRHIYTAERSVPARKGEPSRIIGINLDITARKQSEEQIRGIKDQLETLVAQARIGILVHQDFRPVKVNAELLHMFGLTEAEALGISDIRKFLAEDGFPHDHSFEERLKGAESRTTLEIRCRRKDGAWIDCEIRTFPIQWEGQMSICAMVSDVTAKKRMEAQLRQSQRLETVGQMTGGIAHDFNNLLTIMLGNAEVLERRLTDNSNLHELAEMTRMAAERGAELTGRLLAFSRQQALSIRAANIDGLIANISVLIRRVLDEGIELRSQNARELWKASVDVAQLESAILNLAINARDAMPDGGTLTIETANCRLTRNEFTDAAPGIETEAADFVMIAISDTGVGMDEKTRARAFDPFFTTKDVGKGSGLGLSTVYGFISQLGGHVRLHSEPGRGTSVRLYLPRAADDAQDARDADAEHGPITGGTERILLVEDHDLVRKQAAAQLSALGYDVTTAGNGMEALDLLRRRGDFDLLFTDVVMPKGLNGRELAREASVLRPGLPVLFTSGYTDNVLAQHGRLDPSINLLAKPYRLEALAAKVRYALDRSQRRRVPGSAWGD